MRKFGFTAIGNQRFQCAICKATSTKKRPDNIHRARHKQFICWLTGNDHLNRMARDTGVSIQSLHRHFLSFWKDQPEPAIITHSERIRVIVVDGLTVIRRQCICLIVRDPKSGIPLAWYFTQRENYEGWFFILANLKKKAVVPDYVVSDGQKGLLKAISSVWSTAHIQRCVIHVHRQASAWLTRKPKTAAGQELLFLVRSLLSVTNVEMKENWLKNLQVWLLHYQEFLTERTYHPEYPKRWWYTHRKVRAVRSLLLHAAPDLFHYLDHPDVPRTSNHVEGGINSRLKELLRSHRGLKGNRRVILVAHYLSQRQRRISTRKFN